MDINYYNRLLADGFSRRTNGQPTFQWMQAKDLAYKSGDGREWLKLPDTDPKVWLVAKWVPPQIPKEIWEMEFGGMVPYPETGEYAPTSFMLDPGVEPTERITNYAVHCIRSAAAITAQQFKAAHRDNAERCNVERDSMIDAAIGEAAPAFLHVPGKRDDVSFGGI